MLYELEQVARDLAPHSNYFYPAPDWVASIIVKQADLHPEMLVLEPSAGTGNLCKFISKYTPNLHCVEKFSLNQIILTLKGYSVVWDNFLTYKPQQLYPRIVGNPPFPEQELHITHAYYNCLAPGGKLVFLMSNAAFESKLGYYKKFRQWFAFVGGISIPMPEELYMTAYPNSHVKCYLAIIEKLTPSPTHNFYKITEARPYQGGSPVCL